MIYLVWVEIFPCGDHSHDNASSASYDLHGKLRAYQRNGVREYLVCWIIHKS